MQVVGLSLPFDTTKEDNMLQRRRSGHGLDPVLPYDPVVEVNRFYAETDIEPGYLERLVGAGFPCRRVRRQLGRRRSHPEAR